MSKYNDYIPQALPVYREMFAGDRSNHNYNLCQCNGDLTTWKLPLLTNSFLSELKVPPFHIKRDHSTANITAITLKSTDGTVSHSLTGWSNMLNDLYSPVTKDSIVFLAHTFTEVQDGLTDAGLLLPDKFFYLLITDGTNTWYTEVFVAVQPDADNADYPADCDDSCGYIRLVWSNSGCIISETIHNNSPAFQLFLPVNIAQPEYTYKPDTEDDGEGGFVKTFQRLEKRWKFFVRGPEYLADCLTSTQMFSAVSVQFPNDDFIACRGIEVGVEWETPCFARITFAFTGEFLVKTACCG
jgi:hypothetical protein